MTTALVLSAGGLWAAWQAGAWKALSSRFRPELIVGASAGALNGWAIAGGCTPEELERQWMDPGIAAIMRFGIHRSGVLRPEALHDWTRQLFARFRPRVPFGLAVVELPWLRLRLVRDSDITWQHLAASCAIPLGFPPVAIQGTRYVDGGLRGGLPLWAAEEMGATRAVALDVLNTPGFRMLHKALRWRDPGPALQLARIEPSSRLGSLRDAVVWSAERVTRWVAQGEIDGTRAATSITM